MGGRILTAESVVMIVTLPLKLLACMFAFPQTGPATVDQQGRGLMCRDGIGARRIVFLLQRCRHLSVPDRVADSGSTRAWSPSWAAGAGLLAHPSLQQVPPIPR